MPRIWIYLLSHYIKVLVLCVLAFVFILFTTRLKEIAHFITLGPELRTILAFTYYQLPYVLPIAIPLSALISAILLMRTLSQYHELTALRASGFSLGNVLIPILLASAVLTMGNFYIASELATQAHLQMTQMKNELRSVNPLLLLGNNRLMRMRGLYFEALGATRVGEFAQDAFMAIPAPSGQQMSLMSLGRLSMQGNTLDTEQMTLISPVGIRPSAEFDNLLVENVARSQTSIEALTTSIETGTWNFTQEHFPMPLLLIQLDQEKKEYRRAMETSADEDTIKSLKRAISRSESDIARRISIAFAVFTFTLMGAAFGITISRYKSLRSILYVVLLASFFVVAYFAAKGVSHTPVSALIFYFAPHLLIIGLSCLMLIRINRGIES